MGRHEQSGSSEPEDRPERKSRLGYTDMVEAIGAAGLAGIVVAETFDSGLVNLAYFTAAGLLAYDIARRRSAAKRDPPT